MIRLIKTNDTYLLRLSPAAGFGFTKTNPVREYEILYAVDCPFCGNVLCAQVKSPNPFPDLWGYEETRIMKRKDQIGSMDPNKFEISKILPDYEKPLYETKMCMEAISNYDNIEGCYITTLRLTNHIYNPSILAEAYSNRYEKGDKPCLYSGFMSFNREMAMRYIIMASRVKETLSFNGFNYEDLNFVEDHFHNMGTTGSYSDRYFRFLKGVGPLTIYIGLCDTTYFVSPFSISVSTTAILNKNKNQDFLGFKEMEN